jgi:hypothetical protein
MTNAARSSEIVVSFQEGMGTGVPAGEVYDRFLDGEARIGIYDFIADVDMHKHV